MTRRVNWDKFNRQKKTEKPDVAAHPKKKRKGKPVHPNSMAARKWGKKRWY